LRNRRILISVLDNDLGVILSFYKSENFKCLDAFELKKLLENICENIISQYKEDLKSAEVDVLGSL
jgi:hypothetical protein